MSSAFTFAKQQYQDLGVSVERAMEVCATVPVSMHCWQGDDVCGFEDGGGASGGIAVTGNYLGKAVTADQLRSDIDKARSFIPGVQKLNLHASYSENQTPVERSECTADGFRNWIAWAKGQKIGLDFNPTYFSHPLAADGLTLSHPKQEIREYWIEHGKRCREISQVFAKELGQPCVLNFWMPDGFKDMPADQLTPRERMVESLDAIFADKSIDNTLVLDAVESKLFGLGVESYTVGSHELMYGYAITRKKLYCLDAGHFHPTEVISGKISASMQYLDKILLHVSRGIRWDSDHVVALDDELKSIMREIVRGGYLNRVNIALDFFDASINRIAAWVIGMRNTQKALLMALLEPNAAMKKAEHDFDLTTRFALIEEEKTLPFGAIWDEYCLREGVPVGAKWLNEVKAYESSVLSRR